VKEFKNIYNYNLDELKTIYINKDGEIIGGTNCIENYKKGSKFTPFILDGAPPELQVLEVKKILIVRK